MTSRSSRGPSDERAWDASREGESPPGIVLHEERARFGAEAREAGVIRFRKDVDAEPAVEYVPRQVEHADVERVPARDGDSGEVETLEDGSLSIPVLEEEVVVSKRTVVRERVIVRKREETEHERVAVELRRERVEVETPDEPSGGR